MLKTLLLVYIFTGISCEEARHFRGTYTSTHTVTQVVTSIVPSSCVHVAPTLPPCRNVRYLRFPKLPTFTFNSRENVASSWKTDPNIQTTPLGWGEYLGIFAPTVTVTATNLQISTVPDPSVVVTFAVKGCRPLKLPLDLDRCPLEPTSALVLADTLKTSTVAIAPTQSLREEIIPTATTEMKKDVLDLEGSENDAGGKGAIQPTNALI